MAKGSRKAAKITTSLLNNLILTKATEEDDISLADLVDEENICVNIYYLLENCPKLRKDISKVTFDFENYEMTQQSGYCDLCGYHTLDNGLTFLGVGAGGDWEFPVFFIIYYDGKNLRGYIPENGNVYNKITKTAFGSEDESDIELDIIKHKKKILEMFPNKTEEDYNTIVGHYRDSEATWGSADFSEYIAEWGQDLNFDCKKMEDDIKNRIEVKE